MIQPVKMFKLVTQEMTTHGDMEWAIGFTNRATVNGNEMCSNQVLHCYSDPRLAVLFNPIHADIRNPVLLSIDCSEIINTDGMKYACKEQTPTGVLELPEITLAQKIAFGIKCALLVYKETSFVAWAEKWLSGDVRSSNAAANAANAAANAANAAYAAANAANAAYAAANAAYAAANAAACAAANAAANAAYAAAYAAADAAVQNIGDKFTEIIDWVFINIQ